jgi:H+/Cl- antiporter ClcA
MVIVLRVAVKTPAVLLLAAVVTILVLLALIGITMIFASGGLGGRFAWPSIYVGSILGLAATGGYLLRWHPEVRTELAHVDDD